MSIGYDLSFKQWFIIVYIINFDFIFNLKFICNLIIYEYYNLPLYFIKK